MATQSLAVPRFNSKNIPALVRCALIDERNAINNRINASVELSDTLGRINHPEFARLSDIHNLLDGKRKLTANDLLIAGFVVTDQTWEATEVGERGPMRTDNASVLLEGEVEGRTVRFEVPAEITFTFGEPKLLRGRFEKF